MPCFERFFLQGCQRERVFPHTLAVLRRLSDVFNKIIIIIITIITVVVSKAHVCVWRRAVAHVVWGALRFVSCRGGDGGGRVCRWAGGLWGLVFGGCSLVWRGFVQVCGSSRRWSVCCFGADSGSLRFIHHLTQQTRTTVVLDAGRVVIRCYNDVYGCIDCLWWLNSCGWKQATLKAMHVVLLSLRGYCTTIQCFRSTYNCSLLPIPNYVTKIVVSNLIFLIIYSFFDPTH